MFRVFNCLMVGRITIALVLLMSLSEATGQSSSPAPSGEESRPVNMYCPVTPDERSDVRFLSEFEGQAIGFCCRRCQAQFTASPALYLANFEIPSSSSPDVHDDPSHDDAEQHEHAAAATEELRASTEASSPDHDHDEHAGRRSRVITWVGKFHPPATDLPTGLMLGALLAEGLFLLRGKDRYRSAAAFCVWIGAAGAVGASSLGWFHGGFALVDDDWIQTTHRWLGTGTALVSMLTVALLVRTSKQPEDRGALVAFRLALMFAVGAVTVTGFFGGALVYGLEHYAW